MTHRRHGRATPYTEIGIRRLPCYRCGHPAHHQWFACAAGQWRPVCPDCDMQLNAMVLRWMDDPDAEELIQRYVPG